MQQHYIQDLKTGINNHRKSLFLLISLILEGTNEWRALFVRKVGTRSLRPDGSKEYSEYKT